MLIKLTGNNDTELWVNAVSIQKVQKACVGYVSDGKFSDGSYVTTNVSVETVKETPEQIANLVSQQYTGLLDYLIISMKMSR